jgi:hypothetical protein
MKWRPAMRNVFLGVFLALVAHDVVVYVVEVLLVVKHFVP